MEVPLDEVRDVLNRKRSLYIDLLEALLRDLASFKDLSNHRQNIYRIYSRKDKQAGADPLKSDLKIAKKLGEWRKVNPGTSVTSIHDIIGVTVVTYFTSQIEPVVRELCKPPDDGGLGAYDPQNKFADGYHAVHLKVRRESDPRYHGLTCEIQVKTLLHDGWATKTHDLTYKPEGSIPGELLNQMSLIGDALQLFERQSDLLRVLIEREVRRDKRHRELAQRELLALIRGTSESDVDREVILACSEMRQDFAKLSSCSTSHPDVRRHFEKWRELQKKYGHGKQTCRLITLLAAVRESRDLDDVAIDAVDGWIAEQTELKHKLAAMHFGALVLYSLNHIARAIQRQRETSALARAHGMPDTSSQMNLAYYLAEGQFRGTNADVEDARREAMQIIEEQSLDDAAGRNKNSFLDTKGAVLIAFGTSEDDVRKGMEFCRTALNAVPPDEPYRQRLAAYCRLHEERGWQRISNEWS